MQRILGDFKPEKLFYYFEEISRIPRNSHEEKQISDYLMRFASDHGWEARRDAVLNTVIDVPASSGYEDRPKVILQGHMDMVCVKEPGIEHDFARMRFHWRMMAIGSMPRALRWARTMVRPLH